MKLPTINTHKGNPLVTIMHLNGIIFAKPQIKLMSVINPGKLHAALAKPQIKIGCIQG